MSDNFFLLSVILFVAITLFLFVWDIINKMRVARSLRSLEKNLSESYSSYSRVLDRVEHKLQELLVETRDLNLRTTIVETRLEERSFLRPENRALLGSKPKRGRPRKVVEE